MVIGDQYCSVNIPLLVLCVVQKALLGKGFDGGSVKRMIPNNMERCEWAGRKTKLEIYAALVGWSMDELAEATSNLSGKLPARGEKDCLSLACRLPTLSLGILVGGCFREFSYR